MNYPILDALDALADIGPKDYKEECDGVLRNFLTCTTFWVCPECDSIEADPIEGCGYGASPCF